MDRYCVSESFVNEMIKIYGYSESDPFIQSLRLYTIPNPFNNNKNKNHHKTNRN